MSGNNFISSIWQSFYSQTLYQNVKEKWRFGTLIYLLILIIIYLGAITLADRSDLERLINIDSQEMASQIPTGEISNGVMHIDQTSPHIINFPKNIVEKAQQPMVVFDMDNKLNPNATTAPIIFYKNGWLFKNYESNNNNVYMDQNKKIKVINAKSDKDTSDKKAIDASNTPMPNFFHSGNYYDYPKNKTISFSPNQYEHLVKKVDFYIPLVVYTAIGIAQFLWKLIEAVFCAFIILIFALFCKTQLTYGQAYRLSIVAMTPALLLVTLSKLFIHLPHAGFLALGINLIYLFFATYSTKAKG